MQIEDSGIGIAAEELPRIFEKFFRSSDERISDITGNGLGLAFTQEVIRLHGGKIEVQSELNKGTRFEITLPGHVDREVESFQHVAMGLHIE